MKISSLALLAVTASATEYYPPVPHDAICLNQADFDHGTKIINSPGVYKLCEDISFGPYGPAPGDLPGEDAFDPMFDGFYSTNEFGLGFFSALCVATSGVTLHLNNFTIEQSASHALMQRFFAVIELASSPFISNAGPAQFVGDSESFVPATNVSILGPGVIGLSSHHGIHGNENKDIRILHVEFRDFEVAAVAMNNVDSLEISHCNIANNRQDVPILGMFSSARFLRPYGKYLKETGYEMNLYDAESGQIELKSAEELYANLIQSINNVYEDVVLGEGYINRTKHPEEHHLYDNPFRVIDGPCYGLLVHGRGPAVGGQGETFNSDDPSVTSSNIVIQDNTIENIKCFNNEVPALLGTCGDNACVVNDVRGSVFQTVKTIDDSDPYLAMDAYGVYNGNPVSDMQIMVAHAILADALPSIPSRQTAPNSIGREVIEWAQNGTVFENPQYICNGDSMHHVIKGIIAIRVEDTTGFQIERNTLRNIENLSVEPFSDCSRYHVGASSENLNQCQSGNLRAISVAAVRGFYTSAGYSSSQIKSNTIGTATSNPSDATCIGIDIQGDSKDTHVVDNTVDLSHGLFDSEQNSAELIGIRVRESVDRSVTLENNDCAQETRILNSKAAKALRGRHKKRDLRKIPGHGDIEWKSGGCPFASDYAKQ